jgi:hypothetical protein
LRTFAYLCVKEPDLLVLRRHRLRELGAHRLRRLAFAALATSTWRNVGPQTRRGAGTARYAARCAVSDGRGGFCCGQDGLGDPQGGALMQDFGAALVLPAVLILAALLGLS